MAKDPVCEMEVDERNASYVTTFDGRSYYFCSRGCQNEFDQDPRRYVGKEEEVHVGRPQFESGGSPPADPRSGEEGLLR